MLCRGAVDEWLETSSREKWTRTLKLLSRFRSVACVVLFGITRRTKQAGGAGRAAEKVLFARHLESQYVAHKQYLGGFFAETAKGGICVINRNVACKTTTHARRDRHPRILFWRHLALERLRSKV